MRKQAKVLTVFRSSDTGFENGQDVLTDYEERTGRFKKDTEQVNFLIGRSNDWEEEISLDVQEFVDRFEHINGIYWIEKK